MHTTVKTEHRCPRLVEVTPLRSMENPRYRGLVDGVLPRQGRVTGSARGVAPADVAHVRLGEFRLTVQMGMLLVREQCQVLQAVIGLVAVDARGRLARRADT